MYYKGYWTSSMHLEKSRKWKLILDFPNEINHIIFFQLLGTLLSFCTLPLYSGVCRAAQNLVVSPTRLVDWAVGAADQSLVVAWALQSSVLNGHRRDLHMNPGADIVHSPWKFFLATAFSAEAHYFFSIYPRFL